MPTYTLNEIIENMLPGERRDKALIGRCVDGLALYTAQLAAENKSSSKIDELRTLADKIIDYWGLDDIGSAEPSKDFLEAFDERVYDAKTGGAVTGDIYQTAPNVIYGLHRYGEDMVVSQGEDAMSDILDVSDLMKDIAEKWDFESHIVNDLTHHLEFEVRVMLAGRLLPGQPVSGVVNVGYEITQAVMFDNGLSIVLAHHPEAPSPFVTWRFGIDDDGGRWYEWGHYYNAEDRAKIDYITRADDYVAQHNVKEAPFPFAAAEVGAEQNYNMIDGIPNNAAVPKPDLTDGQTYEEIRELAPETLPENNPEDSGEKSSVLKQIRDAQKAPKTPHKEKAPGKDKNNIEL